MIKHIMGQVLFQLIVLLLTLCFGIIKYIFINLLFIL